MRTIPVIVAATLTVAACGSSPTESAEADRTIVINDSTHVMLEIPSQGPPTITVTDEDYNENVLYCSPMASGGGLYCGSKEEAWWYDEDHLICYYWGEKELCSPDGRPKP